MDNRDIGKIYPFSLEFTVSQGVSHILKIKLYGLIFTCWILILLDSDTYSIPPFCNMIIHSLLLYFKSMQHSFCFTILKNDEAFVLHLICPTVKNIVSQPGISLNINI